MKKIIIVLFISFIFITGCGNKDKIAELKCEMPTTTITITVDKGKIIKYVDEIRGDISKEEINVLNESYLKDIKDNKEAINKLREVIASTGGDCIN